MSGKPSVFEFGSYRLDPSERLLLNNGNSVPLTPKAFELLLVLVERHGHVVAKDDLMRLVWSETFVEETNLTHHISVLRGALGEGGPFIEAVPRRGYRFVAAVTERFEDQPDDSDTKAQNGKRRLLWVAGLAALCSVVGLFFWRTAGARDGGSAVLRAVPLTSYPGMELYPTFSPDGSQVAFSWLKEGEKDTDIYVQQVGRRDSAAPDRRPCVRLESLLVAGRQVDCFRAILSFRRRRSLRHASATGDTEEGSGSSSPICASGLVHRHKRHLVTRLQVDCRDGHGCSGYAADGLISCFT